MLMRWVGVVLLIACLNGSSHADADAGAPKLELMPYVHGNLLALSYFGPDRVVPGPVQLFGFRAGALLLRDRLAVGGEVAYAPLLFGTRYQDAVHLLMVGPYVAPILKAWMLWKLRLVASFNVGLAVQQLGPQRANLFTAGFLLGVIAEYTLWSRIALGFELGMRNQFIRGSGNLDGIGSIYFGVNIAMPEPEKPQQNPGTTPSRPPGTTTRDPKTPGQTPTVGDPPTQNDTGKPPEACGLRLDIHRPISQDDAEPIVDNKLGHGAYTLRNDDADYVIGAAPLTLPIVTVPTDLEQRANANENDLVRVDAINPGLTDVYLFAFKLKTEADLEIDTPMREANGKQVVPDPKLAADKQPPLELLAFNDAHKTTPEAGFPMAIPVGTKTIWIEGVRGGRYRFVLAQVDPGRDRTAVTYNKAVEETTPPFNCRDRAALTVVVVDLFQSPADGQRGKERIRKTAFDVYWGGKPYFQAQVWPGGGTYTWARPYKQGTAVRTVPGAAITGPVAFMTKTADDPPKLADLKHDPKTVSASAGVRGNDGGKELFDGGIEAIHPAPGRVPAEYDDDPAHRYPRRISVQYVVEQETLVRAEPLALLLPHVVVTDPAGQTTWTGERADGVLRVRSRVTYSIRDSFDRPILAPTRDAYLRFYGAGMRAWEALGADPDATRHVHEGTPATDVLRKDGLPKGVTMSFGTAQRSQAGIELDRMTEATFHDRLEMTLGFDVNLQQEMWQHISGKTKREELERARQDARDREVEYRRADDAGKARIRAADAGKVATYPIFSIPQDVILQLRVGAARYDVRALTQNRLEVFAPYYSASFRPGEGAEPLFNMHLRWTPGADTTPRLVLPDHMRP